MATTNLNEPTSAADGNIPYVGSAADDGTGNTLREAISRINARLRELYGSQDASNNVQTPFVDNDNIKDGVVSESKLSISNSPADGQILSWDDSSNQFVWKNEFDGDITSIVAGEGLTGTSLDTDDATLNIGAGDGITVNADDIALASSVAGSGLSYASGVLSVDEIDTDGIASDAITAPKIDFFYDSTNGSTAGNILVADGTKFINRTVIGDVTINSGGSTSIGSGKVLTQNIANNQITTNHIVNDAITEDKLADSIVSDIAANTSKTTFPGFGTTAGTALEGDTTLLQLGFTENDALPGNKGVFAQVSNQVFKYTLSGTDANTTNFGAEQNVKIQLTDSFTAGGQAVQEIELEFGGSSPSSQNPSFTADSVVSWDRLRIYPSYGWQDFPTGVTYIDFPLGATVTTPGTSGSLDQWFEFAQRSRVGNFNTLGDTIQGVDENGDDVSGVIMENINNNNIISFKGLGILKYFYPDSRTSTSKLVSFVNTNTIIVDAYLNSASPTIVGSEPAEWSFDPDTANSVYSDTSVGHFKNGDTTSQSLTRLGNDIASLDSDITFDGTVSSVNILNSFAAYSSAEFRSTGTLARVPIDNDKFAIITGTYNGSSNTATASFPSHFDDDDDNTIQSGDIFVCDNRDHVVGSVSDLLGSGPIDVRIIFGGQTLECTLTRTFSQPATGYTVSNITSTSGTFGFNPFDVDPTFNFNIGTLLAGKEITVELGTSTAITQSLTLTANTGSNITEEIVEGTGADLTATASTLTVTNYDSSQITSVSLLNNETTDAIGTRIATIIENNTESPTDFEASYDSSTNVLTLTSEDDETILTDRFGITINHHSGDGDTAIGSVAETNPAVTTLSNHTSLPTSDPGIAGQVYLDSGVIKVSL